MFLVKLVSILISLVAVSHHSSAQPRVSRSFVRGFLVGYAKGLQEGKHTPVVHQVACAFHPVHPEPMHEPILNEIIDHYPAPMHSEPEPHHHEAGGYSTNNHVTHSSQGSGMHHLGGNQAGGRSGGVGGGHHHDHHGDKKAAATNEISIGHLQKLAPPLPPMTVTELNSILQRSSSTEQETTPDITSSSSKSGKKKAAANGH